MTSDTIFALSSGALPAAIAIVRISGPRAEEAAVRLAGTLPPPRQASLRRLTSEAGDLLDEALVLCFFAPHTATGEALVELHLHGGRAVVTRVLRELAGMPGLREAEPGEFTRRALLNGRLDLTEAEGLADLLSAETEWQRRAALDSAGGAIRRQVEAWRSRLVIMSAQAEAAIDYVGDEDETALDLDRLSRETEELLSEWRDWLDRPPAEMLQQGLKVVLAGPPNSGKSSLFNALAGADKAIVTPIPGTTRDTLEARIDLDGIPLTLVDTAGLRPTSDEVEQIGVERALDAQTVADILLWLGDPQEAPQHRSLLLIHSRADERGSAPPGSVPASVRSRDGLKTLEAALRAAAAKALPPVDLSLMNRRQRGALLEASATWRNDLTDDAVIVAERLRQALAAIDRLSGRAGTEDVLDTLFARFCLGK
ncbi:tRNA modification GTPase [Sphingomonas kaistensis]|uniref:tRNA modification GTPase MnmE n=1 Tax=Sphingomonas kaistensis TaxID=298708 RepID=A0A7X5Y459_9SPHN|nr:tRNA modification GTPase [Sphingomonas kaistensis]